MASIPDTSRNAVTEPRSRNIKESENERGNSAGSEDDDRSDGKTYRSHIERTATEPRDESLHTLILERITPINATTRLFYLSPPSNPPQQTQKQKLTWKPGQWVDLYLPGIEKPGGYSITNFPLHHTPDQTSTPPSTTTPPNEEETSRTEKRDAEDQGIELAIQRPIIPHEGEGKISEQVTWLFQDAGEIVGTEVRVRVGGSFVWPPDSFASFPSSAAKGDDDSKHLHNGTGVKRIIFIAGGMGINPLISMVGYINSRLEIDGRNAGRESESARERESYANLEIQFLYTTKIPPLSTNKGEGEEEGEAEAEAEAQTLPLNSIPFLSRLTSIFSPPTAQPHPPKRNWNLHLFLTSLSPTPTLHPKLPIHPHPHRITPQAIHDALPHPPQEKRSQTLIYICGPPTMTDSITRMAREALGMVETDGDDERARILCERWW
ncbi:hypothetical protein MFRU_012g00600 [Monilinia fructicola]|nr:hypothetical protein MFRU_012g00600 [Monilinia fructicola]